MANTAMSFKHLGQNIPDKGNKQGEKPLEKKATCRKLMSLSHQEVGGRKEVKEAARGPDM